MSRSRSRKHRIAVVTGTRAEFGLLQSTLTELQANPLVDLHLLATGMHLLPAFGNTVRDITKQGFQISAKIPMQRGNDAPTDQAEGLARGVAGIAKYFQKNTIETALVLGDRIEAMAGALAAATTGVRLAHVHGGDVAPGDFDGKFRDAITKLADLHLTATKQAARRVIGMGIDRETVHVVGAPGIDRLATLLHEETEEKLIKSNYALIAYHAYGRAAKTEQRVMKTILSSVRDAGMPRFIIAPNTDRGHRGVIDATAEHIAKYSDEAVLFTSLPRDEFLRKLIRARVLIGNSSAGLLEAPFAGTVSINVGDRQAGRTPGGRSVLHCSERKAAICESLQRALHKHPKSGGSTVYGDGAAGKRIATLLTSR